MSDPNSRAGADRVEDTTSSLWAMGASSLRCSRRGWWRPAITSRCSPPQTRSPRPACTQPWCGWSEDETIDAKVAECLRIASVFERAADFDIIHNGFDFLPLTYSDLVTTPAVTTIHGFSSDRIVPVYERYDNTAAYVSIR